LLWEAGTLGIEVSTSEGHAQLLAYFEERPDIEFDLRTSLTPFGAEVERAAVPNVDWVARFREGFRAFQVGPFQIVPDWDLDPRPGLASPNLTLRVDPGQAFGTGTHETTQLCLLALADLASRSSLGRVLDLGAGTGILAIAAVRLGASIAVGLDNDPEAITSARRHAALNDASLALIVADGAAALSRGQFDLVLANVTARMLLERRDEIAALRSESGRLILSGFLLSDLPDIQASYARLGRLEVRTAGEWAAAVVD